MWKRKTRRHRFWWDKCPERCCQLYSQHQYCCQLQEPPDLPVVPFLSQERFGEKQPSRVATTTLWPAMAILRIFGGACRQQWHFSCAHYGVQVPVPSHGMIRYTYKEESEEVQLAIGSRVGGWVFKSVKYQDLHSVQRFMFWCMKVPLEDAQFCHRVILQHNSIMFMQSLSIRFLAF